MCIRDSYGVMSYTVAQRTQEIGIRLALGASPTSIRQLVLRKAIVLAAIGVIVGLILAFAFAFGLKEALAKLLYDTPLVDVPTLIAVPLVVLAVSGLAAWFPARRATRVDPMTSLRSE